MPLSEGLVFAPEVQTPESESLFRQFEAGPSQSATLYTNRFARRVAAERTLSDASLNASYRYGTDLLGVSARVGDRSAVSLGLGVVPLLTTDANATVRLTGPYYLTVGAQIDQPYGILQRRLLRQRGYGVSAGIMYRRDQQWLGDLDPLNGDRNAVLTTVIAGRLLAQFPFSLPERPGRLRASISVGPEYRYGTIVTRFGLGMVFPSQ